MTIQRTTEPTEEPVTIAELRDHIKIPHEDDDQLLKLIVSAVRDYAEGIIERSLCTQTWVATFDSFPGPSQMGVPFGRRFSFPKHALVLERPPVQQIVSITYLDTGSVIQTMPPADYVDLTYGGTRRVDDRLRITPVFGAIWPINQPQIGSVQVTYVAGYGAPGAVPAGIKHWMKLRAGALYENREEVVVGSRITVSELPYVDSLLDMYKVRMAA